MRKLIALLALGAAPLGAQGLSDASVLGGPQYVSYKIGLSGAEKTVTQLSVPIAFVLPVTERFTVDVSSAWADSRVSSDGVESSKISGLTDTQLRGNLSMFDGSAIFTLGVNIPTGMYKVPDAQQEAAGQIGSDFLLYPVSSMGSGTAMTGGVAIARSLGDWNLGFGGSFRYSQPFDAYQIQDAVLRFEPGSETRVRVGLDRAVGDGRISFAGTYSTFTDDKADSTTFATGARTLAQASLYMPTDNGNDWSISVWDLYRAQGQQIGAVAPSENIANVNLAYGINVGSAYIQPSIEGRAWMRDGEKAGATGTGGLRLRFDALGMSMNPSVTYTMGNVYPAGSTTSIDVSGIRATLLIRVR
ncbi:MAG TPA: hypothetical protein VG916_01240 [Gemmatimonadaceae bacterium]|nr:hypothetical protein [Gemmatimonadaceae bacterium]